MPFVSNNALMRRFCATYYVLKQEDQLQCSKPISMVMCSEIINDSNNLLVLIFKLSALASLNHISNAVSISLWFAASVLHGTPYSVVMCVFDLKYLLT